MVLEDLRFYFKCDNYHAQKKMAKQKSKNQ